MSRGFSLIEMSMVLLVIGMMISGGLMVTTSVVQGARERETNSTLDAIEDVLQLYVIRFGCLPCPADPSLPSSVAASGQARAGVYYQTGCASAACDNARGVLPWRTLALPENDTVDAWGNRITYAVSNSLVGEGAVVRVPPSSYPAGDLEVEDADGNAINGLAAYVLVSHGSNRSYGFAASSGAVQAGSGASAEIVNSAGPSFVQDGRRDISGVGYFDDVVRWRVAAHVIALCGPNACGNP